jgi:hypothetical protein
MRELWLLLFVLSMMVDCVSDTKWAKRKGCNKVLLGVSIGLYVSMLIVLIGGLLCGYCI